MTVVIWRMVSLDDILKVKKTGPDDEQDQIRAVSTQERLPTLGLT